ncbi:hypothetical protein BG004_006978 [Podila humilis]|nr:hypothetical protein BG004_006978 [Podila humilis]
MLILMNKKLVLEEATEWFQDTFQGVVSYETAYDYAEWILHAFPFITRHGHLLFAAKLTIMMIAGDDAVNKHEYVLLLKYLRTKVIKEEMRFMTAIVSCFDDFKKEVLHEENYNDVVEYVARFLESSHKKNSDNFLDRVADTCMITFFAVSLDSNGLCIDVEDHKMLQAAYGTRIDNDLLSYPKEEIKGYATDHRNPLLGGLPVDTYVKTLQAYYIDQLAFAQGSLKDAIFLQARVGSMTWSLFTQRYGRILKTVYEDPRILETLREGSIRRTLIPTNISPILSKPIRFMIGSYFQVLV